MAKSKITLYVDIVSPFGYIAYWYLRNSPTFRACEITYVPILLGGVMKACGNRPPLAIKNKDKWISKERTRWADQYNIPMRPDVPPGFPTNTVTVARVLAAIEMKSPSHLIVALDTLTTAYWAPEHLPHPPAPKGTEYDIKDVESLSALLAQPSVLGAELTKSIIDSISTAEVKAQLSQNTEQAVKDGAFGLPWFVCTNSKGQVEGFWGFDHLGQVARFLELESEAGGQVLRPML